MPLAYKKNCQIPKALWLGNAGTVDLWGRIDRRAYCPGEKIALSGKEFLSRKISYWPFRYSIKELAFKLQL